MRAVTGTGTVERGPVAAETIAQEARHPPDSRNADAGEIVDSPVGKTLLQQFDNVPAIHQGLEFCRGTQIAQEVAAFLGGLQADDCAKQCLFVASLLDVAVLAV